MCPVIEGRGPEAGAQDVPVDGDGEVRGFPGGGGAVLRGAGEPADLEKGVGVALRGGAFIGDAVGGGAGRSELFDQGPERGDGHGYPTHRRAADALRATRPFLVIGTTGEPVLTEQEYALLPDGVFLAPFATRDFSTLATPLPDFARQLHSTQIPGLGSSHQLPTGNTAVLLGDGRSLNLFHADSIPNQGYDAYRAGTLITTRALCARADQLQPGVHTAFADEQIAAAGLFESYYDRYLAPIPAAAPPAARTAAATSRPAQPATGIRACVVDRASADTSSSNTSIYTRRSAD